MHTRRQAERVCVQHWIVRVKHVVVHAVYHRSASFWSLDRCRLRLKLRVGTLRVDRGWPGQAVRRYGAMERRWEGSRGGFARVLVFDNIGLRIVLLVCTNEVNLGRTELYAKT